MLRQEDQRRTWRMRTGADQARCLNPDDNYVSLKRRACVDRGRPRQVFVEVSDTLPAIPLPERLRPHHARAESIRGIAGIRLVMFAPTKKTPTWVPSATGSILFRQRSERIQVAQSSPQGTGNPCACLCERRKRSVAALSAPLTLGGATSVSGATVLASNSFGTGVSMGPPVCSVYPCGPARDDSWTHSDESSNGGCRPLTFVEP